MKRVTTIREGVTTSRIHSCYEKVLRKIKGKKCGLNLAKYFGYLFTYSKHLVVTSND